jgi:AsmA protein
MEMRKITLFTPRRAVVAAALAGFAALAAAVAPWSLTSDALRSAISAQLKELYGLELSVAGRSTVAFLPVPRLKFEDITLTAADGTHVVRGGWLRGEFRILPIIAGRLELSQLALSEVRIDVEADAAGRTPWDAAVASLRGRILAGESLGHIKTLSVNSAYLVYRDRKAGSEEILRDIQLVAYWPNAESTLDMTGSARWRGETVDFSLTGLRPSALVAGRSSRVTAQLTAPPGRLVVSGDANPAGEPKMIGRAAFETRSLRDFSRWSGFDLPLGNFIQAFSLDGEFSTSGRTASWPSVRLNLGVDRLDGAITVRLEGERPAITGTLAADRLDLTNFFAPLGQARSANGLWSSDAIDLGRPQGDLDLRLSASAVRIGAARMEDLAANLLVKPGRVEWSVGRASLSRGVIKARTILASAGEGLELKTQGSFERLDLGSLLPDLGAVRWITGAAQGQFALDGAGETAADIVRRLHGRANVTIKQGELVGVGLNDTLRRIERRPLSAPLDWRGGRTPFDQIHLNLALAEGSAEITDGGIAAANLRGTLQGRASLVERLLAVRLNVEGAPGGAAQPGPSIAFDVNGPWDDVTVTPDVQALIQRSGAAQQLLSPRGQGDNARDSSAAIQ